MQNLFISLNNLIHRFLVMLGLRQDRMYWGIVYDSVSKQPLDPVIVKLVDARTGDVLQSLVTDIAGRYNFLAYPGKFKILVKKSNYSFPSQKIKGNRDKLYSNLYFGEFFELTGDSEVIPFNIPMDPQGGDWNQQAKTRFVNFHPATQYLISRITGLLFWFIFILVCLNLYRARTSVTYAYAGFYLLVFLLLFIAPRPRMWGQIASQISTKNYSRILVELSYPEMPNVVVAKTEILQDGKFFLRINKGTYLLVVRGYDINGASTVLKATKVSVGSLQVVNKNLVI